MTEPEYGELAGAHDVQSWNYPVRHGSMREHSTRDDAVDTVPGSEYELAEGVD